MPHKWVEVEDDEAQAPNAVPSDDESDWGPWRSERHRDRDLDDASKKRVYLEVQGTCNPVMSVVLTHL